MNAVDRTFEISNKLACPFCESTLLRHFRSRELYWFCRPCHQEIPLLIATVCKQPCIEELCCDQQIEEKILPVPGTHFTRPSWLHTIEVLSA